MAKDKQIYYCKECGNEFSRWMGQCPSCKAWNSFVEEKVTKTRSNKTVSVADRPKATSIKNVSSSEETRISTRISELDRVLGGGIVKGSLVLVGGDPGIGKSTLLLEMCRNLVEDDNKVLYVSGEESVSQIKSRAVRLGITEGTVMEERLMLLSDNDMDNIESQIDSLEAEVVVIDSIQTIEASNVEAAPGTISQVREVTARMLQIAKHSNVAVFIVGHVTKEGTVAGPRTLEHMVDSVLYFEGDESGGFRLLRANKNRFGSTNEIGVFNMTDGGLEEVINPSEFFLNGRPEKSSGSSVVCIIEGTRAMLIEIQALCTDSSFSMPRRTSVGIDYNRVNLLTAVLEKRGGISLSGCDCYVNVAGGLKINDPSTDLGIISAIASSFRDKPIDSKMVIIGETGLAGEVRGVRNISQRLKEAAKLGFSKAIIPKSNYNKDLEKLGMEITTVSTIRDALDKI
ncbi:MAG: DNA repair protein RadA [Eubacterium sp.]|nr:DNA repair protein RadA [Eubacterium sp.]